jgi:hypothetical protein
MRVQKEAREQLPVFIGARREGRRNGAHLPYRRP